ncbi:MAG: hypothetical protein AB8G99_00180 [Planctomycetaceae bacterium]
MLNTLKKVANKVLGTPASRRRKQSRTSDTPIQALEDRSLLAGNVLASFSARGDLVLKGDNSGNAVNVQRVDSNIIVQGQNWDGVPTQINGRASAVFPATAARHLKINMKGGDDFVSVFRTSFTGNVTANMGSGQDIFSMGGIVTQQEVVLGNVKVNLGSNSSTFPSTASLGYIGVGGNVNIKGGSGRQDASVTYAGIVKKLSVNLGKGNDTLTIRNTSAGSHKLNGGGGLDVFHATSLFEWTNETNFEGIIQL